MSVATKAAVLAAVAAVLLLVGGGILLRDGGPPPPAMVATPPPPAPTPSAPPAPSVDPRDAAVWRSLDTVYGSLAPPLLNGLDSRPAPGGVNRQTASGLPISDGSTAEQLLAALATAGLRENPPRPALPLRFDDSLVDARRELLAGVTPSQIPRELLTRVAQRWDAAWTVSGGEVLLTARQPDARPRLRRRISLPEPGAHADTLQQILAQLSLASGMDIALGQGTADLAWLPIDVRFEDVDLDQALDWLAGCSGLTWQTRQGRVILSGPARPRPLAGVEPRPFIMFHDVRDLAAGWPAGRQTLAAYLHDSVFPGSWGTGTWMVEVGADDSWEAALPPTVPTDERARLHTALAGQRDPGRRYVIVCQDRLVQQAWTARLASWRESSPFSGALAAVLARERDGRAAILARLDQPGGSTATAGAPRDALLLLARAAGVPLVLDPGVATLIPGVPPAPVGGVGGTWRQALDRLDGLRWEVWNGVLHVGVTPRARTTPSATERPDPAF